MAAAVADMDIPDADFLNSGTISQEEFDSLTDLLGNVNEPSNAMEGAPSNTGPSFGNQHHQGRTTAELDQDPNAFQPDAVSAQHNQQIDMFHNSSTSKLQDFQF